MKFSADSHHIACEMFPNDTSFPYQTTILVRVQNHEVIYTCFLGFVQQW